MSSDPDGSHSRIIQVGSDLYRTFFEGYTRKKQWGLDPCELDKSVTARVPTRTSIDDRYFLDSIQAMPLHRLHPHVRKHARSREHYTSHGDRIRRRLKEGFAAHIIFTGPIDEYFDHRFGPLPYVSDVSA